MGDGISRHRVLPFWDPCPFLPPAVQYYPQPALIHFWLYLCGGGEREVNRWMWKFTEVPKVRTKVPRESGEKPIPTGGAFQEEGWYLRAQGNLKLSEQQEAWEWPTWEKMILTKVLESPCLYQNHLGLSLLVITASSSNA